MLIALSTTTAVSHWLETAVSPCILHVFDHVCNLVDGDRRVISLVTPKIGKGPFSLVVDLPRGNFTDFITAKSQVSVVGFEIQIGSLVVDASTTELWNARPLWENVPRSAITTYLPLFESKLTNFSGDGFLFGSNSSDPAALKAKTAVLTLQEGLKTNNLTAIQEGTRSLAGLGIGLTPAGDDFLLGVMYGLWLKNSQRGLVLSNVEVGAEAQRIVEVIAEEAVGRTTTLSGAWLEVASRGEAGQAWHELVGAMSEPDTSTGSVDAISQAINHILTTGHTSGADALAGFITIIRIKG